MHNQVVRTHLPVSVVIYARFAPVVGSGSGVVAVVAWAAVPWVVVATVVWFVSA